eukprot:4162731-Prymnesium_polylepis.1
MGPRRSAGGVGEVACRSSMPQHPGEYAQHRTQALHTHMHTPRRRPWHSRRCLVGCACGLCITHHNLEKATAWSAAPRESARCPRRGGRRLRGSSSAAYSAAATGAPACGCCSVRS